MCLWSYIAHQKILRKLYSTWSTKERFFIFDMTLFIYMLEFSGETESKEWMKTYVCMYVCMCVCMCV